VVEGAGGERWCGVGGAVRGYAPHAEDVELVGATSCAVSRRMLARAGGRRHAVVGALCGGVGVWEHADERDEEPSWEDVRAEMVAWRVEAYRQVATA